MKNSGMFQYYFNRIQKNSLKINWRVMALLLGTKMIDLSEICEHEKNDDAQVGEYEEIIEEIIRNFFLGPSFGLVLGDAAVRLKQLNIARLLLNGRWEGDQEDLSNLLVYCMSSEGDIRLQFIELLMADERVDPSAMDNEAIQQAYQNGHHESVAFLLAYERVDPSAMDNEAIRVITNAIFFLI
jgi:hypothetical protein